MAEGAGLSVACLPAEVAVLGSHCSPVHMYTQSI
jgi:hypothetical protein